MSACRQTNMETETALTCTTDNESSSVAHDALGQGVRAAGAEGASTSGRPPAGSSRVIAGAGGAPARPAEHLSKAEAFGGAGPGGAGSGQWLRHHSWPDSGRV